MKKKYDRIMEVISNGWKVQVNRNSLYYLVKVGKSNMNNYDKKAKTERCDDLDGVKAYIKGISSLKGLELVPIENQLNKAMKLESEGNVPIVSVSKVEKGGILSKIDSWDLDKISDY